MKIEEIALGALLHDIGKFLQRARPPGTGLGEQSRRLREMACPYSQGRSSHLHVLYTNEFASALPFLPEGISRENVANLALYHHRPDTPEQRVIQEADHLSSGMERDDRHPAEGEAGPSAARRIPMVSVASTVTIKGLPSPTPAELPIVELSPGNAFPARAQAEQQDLTASYARLWDAFCNEWAANRCAHPIGFINRACSTIERFTWCIPSATNTVPDISLYDHLKTTAAIAVCLASAPPDHDRPFLLVAGDLAGIQDYIFHIRPGTGGLARRLRSRSFDVNAFAEAISLAILREMNLPLVHRILFAGGKFHLLLPNTQAARNALDKVRSTAAEWLFERSSGILHPAIASMPMTRPDLKRFSSATARLLAALADEKNRPGAGLLADDTGWAEQRFVLPFTFSGEDRCESCRARPASSEGLCTVCRADADRGGLLPNSRLAAFYPDDAGGSDAPAGSYHLASDEAALPAPPELAVAMDGRPATDPSLPLVSAYKARRVPRNDRGDVATFEEIAQRARGDAALAYLKMDVDNLGFIFSQGLNGQAADRSSISRVAALSRTLELFFAGHLQTILENEFPDVYLVYSGGDDLLAIGPWNVIFDLAERIRTDFRRYTADNPAWTLSAGIVVARRHTPLLQAVDDAQRNLEISKSAPGSDVLPADARRIGPATQAATHTGPPPKDRITAFETTIPWSRFGPILATARKVLGWLESGVLNTAKVRRLLHYAHLYRKFQETGRTVHLQYAPLLARDLRRNWTEKTEHEREAKTWADRLLLPDSHEMKTLHFISRYALHGARTTERG